ncbi:MAG: MarR family transcriptional regulator [Myxococcaceae bacterium]
MAKARNDKKKLDDVDLGQVLGFLQVVWRLDHALQSKSKRMSSNLGITGPQRFVLRVLTQRPGLSAGELAQLLHLHPSTLTGVLRRLEERGLLARETDSDDARRAVLKVTNSGKALTAKLGNSVEDVVRKVLASAPKSQAQGARALLGALADALEA